jgi:hypothetical protein
MISWFAGAKMLSPHSNSSTITDCSNPSLITLIENTAETNNVDGIKGVIELAWPSAALREIPRTGLHGSARNGCVDAMKCILREGREVIKPEDLVHPLFHAVAGNDVEVVQVLHLLASDDDWRVKEDKILRLFLETFLYHGPDEFGYTPLHYACQKNKTEFLRGLLQSPEIIASLTVADPFGYNALHIAVQQSRSRAC